MRLDSSSSFFANAALPDEVSTEQIDDLIGVLEARGITVQREESSSTDGDAAKSAAPSDENEESDAPARVEEELGRTDDPVRMYLREMGSIELLSREG